jgi:hypothetical protein
MAGARAVEVTAAAAAVARPAKRSAWSCRRGGLNGTRRATDSRPGRGGLHRRRQGRDGSDFDAGLRVRQSGRECVSWVADGSARPGPDPGHAVDRVGPVFRGRADDGTHRDGADLRRSHPMGRRASTRREVRHRHAARRPTPAPGPPGSRPRRPRHPLPPPGWRRTGRGPRPTRCRRMPTAPSFSPLWLALPSTVRGGARSGPRRETGAACGAGVASRPSAGAGSRVRCGRRARVTSSTGTGARGKSASPERPSRRCQWGIGSGGCADAGCGHPRLDGASGAWPGFSGTWSEAMIALGGSLGCLRPSRWSGIPLVAWRHRL